MKKVESKGRSNFIRKDQSCVSVNLTLCGEPFKIAEDMKKKFKEKYGGNIGWPAIINMLILGEKVA